MSANDTQVGGAHYQKPIQVWDFVVQNKLGYLEGNIIKYVVRHREKGGVEDLKKARHYLDKLIEVVGISTETGICKCGAHALGNTAGFTPRPGEFHRPDLCCRDGAIISR